MKETDAKNVALTELKFDKEISIAIGVSRQSKRWKNKTFLISDFIKKLSVTKRTDETIDEYLALPKAEQDEIKDSNGAFVGAMLKGGRRRKGDVANRTCLTMDLDYATPGAIEIIKKELSKISYTLYSTHKNQPNKPRLRLLIWPDRVMAVNEYQAVVRRLADKIGMEFFDTTGFDINRLYYFATTSKDSEYIFYHNDAAFLPVDKVLAAYGDNDAWKDVTLWPRSSRETKALDRLLKKQADPLKKKGIVGAFCRVVSIEKALDEHLIDVYKKESADRYTYIEGTSSKGLVVYDKRFVYSNHDSDPAGGQLCNSFDIIRIHKFGHEDDGAKIGTPTHRMPSYLEMSEWARDISEVKADLVKNKMDVDAADFDVFDDAVDGNEEKEDKDWHAKLQVRNTGEILGTFFNAVVILKNDPKVKDLMRWNEFTVNTESAETGEDWSARDSFRLREYIGGVYGVDFPETKIEQAIENNAYRHAYHPVRDYLEGLMWDGVRRIETLFIDYFGCEDNIYVREVPLCWFSAAVHRVYEPGFKFDSALVIAGAQGIGKTSFIRELGLRKWYGELSSFENKLAVEQMSGKLVMEIAEMSATNKSELEQQKSFLSATHTRDRPPYARRPIDYKRQCVFFASTNRKEYLKDSTGNRRWWPLEATVEEVDVKKLKGEVDQIWAEAYMLWVQSKSVFLSKDAAAIAFMEQENKRESDVWEGIINEWIETDAYNDRYATKEGSFEGMDSKLEMRQRVCIAEIWDDCLKIKRELKRYDSTRIAAILDHNPNWKRHESKDESVSRMRFGMRYGHQLAWKKIMRF